MKTLYIISLFLSIFLINICYAQTQQGYVRTIGRPGRPGMAVPNATIRVKGAPNAVLSNKDGRFTVYMPNKKEGDEVMILSVQKTGYELQDKNYSGRRKVFSSTTPIYVLLVDSKQLAADKQRIEKRAFQTAEENYKKRISSLESQLKDKTLSEESYLQELENLQRRYDNYLALVGDLAERYARTDYDNMDSIDREINICIENGELEKADSLIHTVFDPQTVLERNRAAKEEINQRMAFAQKVINKAQADIAALQRDREYAARVVVLCQLMAEEYLLQNQQEKAHQCLKQAWSIQSTLYGEESPEAIAIQNKIKKICP